MGSVVAEQFLMSLFRIKPDFLHVWCPRPNQTLGMARASCLESGTGRTIQLTRNVDQVISASRRICFTILANRSVLLTSQSFFSRVNEVLYKS